MIVVDVETTGTNPQIHSIVSIGAVEFENPRNQFYGVCHIREDAEIMPKALEINGFTEAQITDPKKPSLETLMCQFVEWMGPIADRTLVGENPAFDRDFLIVSAEKVGLPWPLGHRTIDLHTLGYVHYLKRKVQPPREKQRTNLSLDGICVYGGLPPEPMPHNALQGAKIEAEIFSRLVYGRVLFEEFEQYTVPEYLQH